MTAKERRNQLVAAKNDLQTLLTELNHKVGIVICKLVEEADSLIPKVLSEKQGNSVIMENLTREIKEDIDINGTYTGKKVEKLGGSGLLKRRRCSNCGQPGHRATTCTSRRRVANPFD